MEEKTTLKKRRSHSLEECVKKTENKPAKDI